MSERRTVCVLCKRDIDVRDAGRTEVNGGPAYRQLCTSCGWFVIEAPAVTVLDSAVKDRVRTREDILEHFCEIIGLENADSNPAIITTDAAQAYCYGQAFAMAAYVYEQLVNGPLGEMQEDISHLKGEVNGPLREMQADMVALRKDMNARFTDLENHLDRMDADIRGVKKHVAHIYRTLEERSLI